MNKINHAIRYAGKLVLTLFLLICLFIPTPAFALDYNSEAKNYLSSVQGDLSSIKTIIQQLPNTSVESGQKKLAEIETKLDGIESNSKQKANLFKDFSNNYQVKYQDKLTSISQLYNLQKQYLDQSSGNYNYKYEAIISIISNNSYFNPTIVTIGRYVFPVKNIRTSYLNRGYYFDVETSDPQAADVLAKVTSNQLQFNQNNSVSQIVWKSDVTKTTVPTVSYKPGIESEQQIGVGQVGSVANSLFGNAALSVIAIPTSPSKNWYKVIISIISNNNYFNPTTVTIGNYVFPVKDIRTSYLNRGYYFDVETSDPQTADVLAKVTSKQLQFNQNNSVSQIVWKSDVTKTSINPSTISTTLNQINDLIQQYELESRDLSKVVVLTDKVSVLANNLEKRINLAKQKTNNVKEYAEVLNSFSDPDILGEIKDLDQFIGELTENLPL